MKEKAITVWLKADLDVLVRRVGRKATRPLLIGKDPRQVLQELMDKRYPVYAEADITVHTDDRPASAAVDAILAALGRRLEPAAG
jgi:shikimate kinase